VGENVILSPVMAERVDSMPEGEVSMSYSAEKIVMG